MSQGTSADRIYFTSLEDDSVGGDTNATTTPPAPGDYNGVKFTSGAAGNISQSVFRYGGGIVGVIRQSGGAVSIANTRVHNNANGLKRENGTMIVSQSSIHNNTNYGLSSASFVSPNVNAVPNWWGSATGPFHATLNPLGAGNSVSNYVDFIPWLAADPN